MQAVVVLSCVPLALINNYEIALMIFILKLLVITDYNHLKGKRIYHVHFMAVSVSTSGIVTDI